MMNHFFALLIVLGLIFGIYKATAGAASLTERDVRIARWEQARDDALAKRKDALANRGDLRSLDALPRVDEAEKIITLPDGSTLTPDSYTISASEMLRARWNILKRTGNDLTLSAVNAPQLAVTLCIEYIGLMALWLGVMRVAEKGGIVRILARALSPILRRIFPDVPRDHPAMSGMVMNIAANMLGLDNAATPLGLAAMKDLQKLNPRKDTATNAMVMFLAINTSSVVVLPFAILGFRAASGSQNPQGFLMPMLLATMCSTAAALLLTPLFARFSPAPTGPSDGGNPPDPPGPPGPPDPTNPPDPPNPTDSPVASSAPATPPTPAGGAQ